MKITNYMLVVKYNLRELENSVNDLIKDGWQPFGSMSSTLDSHEHVFIFIQAMVEYSEEG